MKSGDSLLLDTHVWLWLSRGDEDVVSPAAWRTVRSHIAEGSAAISDISFWECALKAAQGRLDLGDDVASTLADARRASKIGVMEVDRSILLESALMRDAHRDPVDRIIMATAMKYDMTVATADRSIIEYAKRNRNLKVMDMGMGE